MAKCSEFCSGSGLWTGVTAQRTHFWHALLYRGNGLQGAGSLPTPAPTLTPEHLPALLGYRENLGPSDPWLSGLVLPEVQGCLWLELQMSIWIVSPTAWAVQCPSFSPYRGLNSMWQSEERTHRHSTILLTDPGNLCRSLQQLMRNSWEYKSTSKGAASLSMCFVLFCFVLRAVPPLSGGLPLPHFQRRLREQGKVVENKRKVGL